MAILAKGTVLPRQRWDVTTVDKSPGLRTKDQILSRFPSREENGTGRCVGRASTVTWRDHEWSYNRRYRWDFFWLAFQEAHPQMVFNASRPCEKLAMSRCSYGSFDGSHSSPLLPVGVQTLRHTQRI